MKAHFMYDCHLFAAVELTDPARTAARVRELFDEDGCGSVFVRDGRDRGVEELTMHGRYDPKTERHGVTDKQIADWVALVYEKLAAIKKVKGSKTYSFDDKCMDLSEHFWQKDDAADVPDFGFHDLAQAIQDCVEGFFEARRSALGKPGEPSK